MLSTVCLLIVHVIRAAIVQAGDQHKIPSTPDPASPRCQYAGHQGDYSSKICWLHQVGSCITQGSTPAVAKHEVSLQTSNAWAIASLVGAYYLHLEFAAITYGNLSLSHILILQAEYTDGILTIITHKDLVRPRFVCHLVIADFFLVITTWWCKAVQQV